MSARLGHIKGQLNAAWEQTMWQTFREEATLLNVPAGDLLRTVTHRPDADTPVIDRARCRRGVVSSR